MMSHIHKPLDNLFGDHKTPETEEEESAVVLGLLCQILEYGSRKRLTAEDLLKHPWFSS
jgi:hypothetical protein